MFKLTIYRIIGILGIGMAATSCKLPSVMQKSKTVPPPQSYTAAAATDTTSMATTPWKNFFADKDLANLIDTALKNNQELNITLQEIEIAKNDVLYRRGALFPSVSLGAGAGVEKVGLYTSQGAGDASTEILPGKEVPEVLPDLMFGANAHWELDIWNKLHNAKKAAVQRYLSTVEGKNFVVTGLVAEVASSYYELLALDNQLDIIRQNIELQKNALEIVKLQKLAGQATELAVQKFQAEVFSTQSLEFDVQQRIRETENRINFLLGRYPQPIARDKNSFFTAVAPPVKAGIPSQLLSNRPDIRQAERDLEASKLDVKVARAEFYPSLDISAVLGAQAFNPKYLVKLPESLLYSVAGDLAGPLINRKAIKAEFLSANARQLQALYNYDRSVLNAYLEVSTQLSGIDNLQKSFDLKSKEVDALTKSIDISNDLFKSARVDYFEVLMTQRDALESKLELIETKQKQLNAVVSIYKDLGGGWK